MLASGAKVCSYCPDWMLECKHREDDAKRLMAMPRHAAVAEYRRRKQAGEDLTLLDKVITRLKGGGYDTGAEETRSQG